MKPGDVVQLKCGGPRMVISHPDPEPKRMPGVEYYGPEWRPAWVVCWTVQNALRTAAIVEEALKVVEAAD